MSVRSRIALLVQAQGARRAASDVDSVARSTDRLDKKSRAAGRGMKQSEQDARRFTGTLRGVARAATIGAVAAGGLAVAFGARVVGEWREAYKAGRQTDAVLKSTGGAAHITAKQVGDLANAISLKAGIDDEAIQQGENLLLTFRAVRNEVGKGNDIFNQATQAATDMGVALGTDTKSAALMLGKALNDPARGYSRLMRSGVSFTESQIKQIKTLQKNGDLLGAQKVILGEVQKEFAGSAAAQADPMDKATVAVNNLAEAVGFALAPTITKALTWLAGFVNQMSAGRGAGGAFRRVLIGVGAQIASVVKVLVGVVKWVAGLVRQFIAGKPAAVALGVVLAGLVAGFVAFKVLTFVVNGMKALRVAIIATNAAMAANPAVLVVAALVAVGVALVVAYKKVAWFRHGVQAAWGWIKGHWPLLLSILTGPLGAATIFIIRHWSKITATFGRAKATISRAARGMFDGIKNAFRTAINFVIRGWNALHFHIGAKKILGHTVMPGFDIGTPKIPLLAQGGVVGRAGAGIVGDAGPELLDLPAGARVTPLEPAGRASLLGGDGDLVVHVHSHLDGREVATSTRRHALRDLLAQAPA